MAETLRLTPGETVTIRKSSPELLEVEAAWAPEGKPPPAHFHPSQEEHFEILEGTLTARVDGEEGDLGHGDALDIPRGAKHQMWNRTGSPARALWQTRPAGRTESWFRSIDALHREGRVGSNGMPGPLAYGVFLTEYRDVFRLAAPDMLARPVLGILGAIGRLRGYKPNPANF
jgi:mannose-6-phosphate isomerase-like protein (cupin superfamily)